MTTQLEAQMLRNIALNEFAPGNGRPPETFEECGTVWSDCLDCGPEKIPSKSIPGIVASLVKKGLVGTDRVDGCWLTKAGFEAWRDEEAERYQRGLEERATS
jgi:hypothetical protein